MTTSLTTITSDKDFAGTVDALRLRCPTTG
jgi:hypothetical protein